MHHPPLPWLLRCPPTQLQLIQKNNVKAVHVMSSASELKLLLAGQAPQVALEVAHSSIKFCEWLAWLAWLAWLPGLLECW